ncbi:precorrin-6y C5,15-methyltransferase (decarboxylating) subunit CbiE [Arsenicicoccus piscis]|uniref:precorrin-6y C5,15-methyltransferase (decarboxylating) subunit CbiE n=1 Tax=Arsenicicoccus piscis TaxID=673954 RepID=UPI001F4CF646|nr:precorrin-6y C5,15-methyltransferase (decarboxylating) subunit CbiE [Arsenicicoccus piscis]MCH8628510.1 precorrin-6y C5,15-methyltransferase (decarboxylating) subunit CbiE [Arsenicicoccus piscis]
MSTAPVTVVGIGVDGWEGLGPAARQAVAAAAVVMGSDRQRRLVAGHHHADEVDLPKPLRERLTAEVDEHADRGLVVLASGDPMHYGIGRTLVELLGAERVHVVPHASSMSLACARMGWPLEDVTIVSVVGRPLEALALAVRPGRRLLVLSADSGTPGEVAALLRRLGLGDSRLSVLDDLGGPGERRVDGVAATWSAKPGSELNIVAVDVRPDQEPPRLAVVPGLPDEVYDSDGQLTKRHVRAATLATLAPAPGELLWDVGGGSGSIAIEWMRADPTCTAVTVEPHLDRVARIRRNARTLGVPGLQVVPGSAPGALVGLPPPDAVFIGGGLTQVGVVDAVLAALRPGGRLVANTVTLESEAVLVDLFRRLGGTLTRLEVSTADAVGSFAAWRPARPVTQWSWVAPDPVVTQDDP